MKKENNTNSKLFYDNINPTNILNNNMKTYNTTGFTQSPLYDRYEEEINLFKENIFDIMPDLSFDCLNDEARYFINNDKTNEIAENNLGNNIKRSSHFKNGEISQTYKTSNKTTNNKKLGRKRKGEDFIENNGKAHTKDSEDNIRIKFKRYFFDFLIEWINYEIGKSPKLRNIGKIVKLNSEIMKNNSKAHILKMLDLSAAEYLSNDISSKYTTLKIDHNKTLIQLIYNLKEEKITEILDKSIRELMKIFCNDSTQFTNTNIKGLQDCIEELKSEFQDENYIEKFKEEAENYEDRYKGLKGREKKNIKTI